MSEWLNSITNAISKIVVKSVVDALGKQMLIALVLFGGAAYFIKILWVLIVIACFPVLLLLIFVGSYLYCLCKNPDLLRSEEYNIKKQVVEVLGDKDNYLQIDSEHLASIANPHPYQGGQLERKEDADE